MVYRVRASLAPSALMATFALALAMPASPTSMPQDSTSAARTVSVPAAARVAAVKPNFLVITADDMRADDLRWMPHVRHELAARGLSFRNSFTPNPLCCPARATFLTGRYSHNHRVLDVTPPYGFGAFDDSTTLATVLRRSGYRTALVGKYLNGYGEQPTYRGHRSLRYVPPGWTQWWGSSDHHWNKGEWPGGGTYNYLHLTSNVNGVIRTWPQTYTTRVTARQTQHLVTRFGRARPSKPWFIWWTPVAPHHGIPLEKDDPGTTADRNGNKTFWVTPARPSWVQHRFDARISHGAGTPLRGQAERSVADKPAYLRRLPALNAAEKRAERTVTRQRAEALFVLDQRIGDTLAALRKSRQLSRTVVVFNSDNGYYLGEHRKRQGKVTLHEPAIRVPLIVAGPGVPAGVRFDPASMADLAVTIASFAGTRLPRADGVSLRPAFRRDRGWNRAVLMEGHMLEGRYLNGTVWHSAMRGLNTMGIRTGRYVFVRYADGETELYDLLRDPLEMTSLAGRAVRPLRHELIGVWNRMVVCRQSTCQVVLPRDLRISPSRSARITRAQERARRHHYGY